MDISDVSYPPGSVLSVEKVANVLLPSLANADLMIMATTHSRLLHEYLTERFGPVASFTGTGKADRWSLNINRHPQGPGKIYEFDPWSHFHSPFSARLECSQVHKTHPTVPLQVSSNQNCTVDVT